LIPLFVRSEIPHVRNLPESPLKALLRATSLSILAIDRVDFITPVFDIFFVPVAYWGQLGFLAAQ